MPSQVSGIWFVKGRLSASFFIVQRRVMNRFCCTIRQWFSHRDMSRPEMKIALPLPETLNSEIQ